VPTSTTDDVNLALARVEDGRERRRILPSFLRHLVLLALHRQSRLLTLRQRDTRAVSSCIPNLQTLRVRVAFICTFLAMRSLDRDFRNRIYCYLLISIWSVNRKSRRRRTCTAMASAGLTTCLVRTQRRRRLVW